MFLLVWLAVAPVFGVSYVDLERTTIGELDVDYGYAVDFDGTDDYVGIPTDLQFNASDFTVEIWAKPTALSRQGNLIDKSSAWNQERWELYQLDTDKVRFNIYSGGQAKQVISTTNLTTTEWMHIVGRRTGTTLELFVNGVSEGTPQTINAGTTFNGTNECRLARLSWGAVYYEGLLDEVRVYSRALNQTEITYSYNSGDGIHIPLNQTGLLCWLHLNAGSGTFILDSSTEGNNGTLNGDTDEWVTGKVATEGSIYSADILVSELEASYDVKLYNSSDGLVCNATADASGTANLTLPSAYRSAAFEGTFRVYDDNASFLYSKWFEDVHGGDTYEIKQESRLGFILGGFAAVMAIIAVTLIFARKRKQE